MHATKVFLKWDWSGPKILSHPKNCCPSDMLIFNLIHSGHSRWNLNIFSSVTFSLFVSIFVNTIASKPDMIAGVTTIL